MASDMKNRLMTVNEVAEVFDVKPSTVRTWMSRKQIPQEAIFKIGETVRLKRNVMEKFIFGDKAV